MITTIHTVQILVYDYLVTEDFIGTQIEEYVWAINLFVETPQIVLKQCQSIHPYDDPFEAVAELESDKIFA